MKVNYQLKKIAPMAWIADVKDGIANILHGKSVYCVKSFFVEGAWNGEFDKGEFVKSNWFCGTGAEIQEDRIVFSTPSQVSNGLFSAENPEGGYRISNSLHLLLADLNWSLDREYVNYEVDFNSILNGIEDYKKTVHAHDEKGENREVQLWYYRNLEIFDDNRMEVSLKEKEKPFADFEDYYKRLDSAVAALCENAKASGRNHAYESVTTISKGYDAPCCAAIARRHGCSTAVTFTAVGKYAEDSGVQIAEKLGYENIVERDAMGHLNREDLFEAEYIGSGELGPDISFAAFDEDVKGHVVFFGDRGDSVWARENPAVNDDFHFVGTLSHLGMAERRLWLDCISVPLPMFGASSWTSIQAIAKSEEMKPWALMNNYDRPIPRRICEEAGVPREDFGMRKHGAGFTLRYDSLNRMKKRLSKAAYTSFSKWVKAHRKIHLRSAIQFYWKMRGKYLKVIGIKERLFRKKK